METIRQPVEFFGKKMGTLIVTKNEVQGTITVIFEAIPDPDLEVRASASYGGGGIETTFKKKEG